MATNIGTIQSDTIIGKSFADLLFGKGDNDILKGKGGGDTIRGNGGDDTLKGNSGKDILIGGGGDDRMTGGVGADRFVFGAKNSGKDVITDFDVTKDVLQIPKGLNNINIAKDVIKHAVQKGDDVVISLGGDNTIKLKNVSLDDLKDHPGQHFDIV